MLESQLLKANGFPGGGALLRAKKLKKLGLSALDTMTDEQLLDTRFCDLPLSVNESALETSA